MKHEHAPSLKNLQRYVSATSIGPTTLRNMRGTKGKLEQARSALADFELGSLTTANFPNILAKLTTELENIFKISDNSGNWGAARKAVNLFFREVAYNYKLRDQYGLSRIECQFECPLDSFSMKGIREDEALPKTVCLLKHATSVSDLNKSASDLYQARAWEIAKSKGTLRVHLDIGYWLESKKFSAKND